jgi:hypothetical protein
MVEFFTAQRLEDIPADREMLKFAQKRIEEFHRHDDGSPVQLHKLDESEIEGSGIDYNTDLSGNMAAEPEKVPFRVGCTCGMKFEASGKDIQELGPSARKDEYSGSDAQDTGYSQEQSGYMK